MLRNITRITAPATHPARRTDVAATIAGAVVTPVVPVAVASLVATAGTARITLTWPAVTGAVSYDVESSASSTGTFTALSSAGGTGFADLSASTAAITYYRVRARNAVGAGPYSPVASATAVAASVVSAGATTTIPVPTNLRTTPTWITASNAPSDILRWDGVAAATSYKVYLGDLLVGTITGASGNPPAKTYQNITPRQEGLLYTVTAITAQGESVPSTVSACENCFAPGHPPYWADAVSAQNQIKFMLAEPEWNAGVPRILVRWGGGLSGTPPFNVYRDGILVASGLSACLYVDSALNAGQTYSYTTTSINNWSASQIESPFSSPATATAPTGPPALSSTPVPITRTVSRDDGVFVFFNHVTGAKDYICYKDNSTVAPEILLKNGKAAGEWRHSTQSVQDVYLEPDEICIQMNDLDTVNPTTLRLAAVDKLARYQKQDGMMAMGMGAVTGGPSMPNMNNEFVSQVNGPVAVDGFVKNGQGDPSNVPNIVALSAPFAVSCTPFVFTGTDGHGGQPFLDRFRTGINEPIVAAPIEPDLARLSQDTPAVIGNRDFQRYLTPNWSFTNYGVDNANTKIFFMPHLMTTVYDGGGPDAPFNFGRAGGFGLHIANSSLTLQPRENDPASPNFGQNKYFSIAGGKTLHMTMEVDTHVNGRRFVLMMLKGRGQTLYNGAPTKMHLEVMQPSNRITADANLFSVLIGPTSIEMVVFQANGSTTSRPFDPVDVAQIVDYGDATSLFRQVYPNPRLNGTTRELDKMHRFHLYINHTQFRVVEEEPGGIYSIAYERFFPAGYVLPWDEMEPVFVHEVYHTGIDSLGAEEYIYTGTPGGPDNRQWVVNSPYRDERHWDNMGARVLDAFPVEPLGMQADRTSIPAGTTVTVNVTIPLGGIQTGRFSVTDTRGSTITNTTIVDNTHAAITVHAGTVGPSYLRYECSTFNRTLLIPIV